jgi:hypothetical protein
MSEGIAPRHLDGQMLYCLKQSIKDAMDMLGKTYETVKLKPGYETEFERTFDHLRNDLMGKMKNENNRGLDAHKLAAISCLSVLLSRPLHIPANGEGHLVNETVAFLLAVRVLRNYQIKRFCKDKTKWAQLRASIGQLETPTLIYDSRPVIINTIIAFSHLSRTLGASQSPGDHSLMVSSFLFFLDAHSQEAIEKLAAEL